MRYSRIRCVNGECILHTIDRIHWWLQYSIFSLFTVSFQLSSAHILGIPRIPLIQRFKTVIPALSMTSFSRKLLPDFEKNLPSSCFFLFSVSSQISNSFRSSPTVSLFLSLRSSHTHHDRSSSSSCHFISALQAS